MLKKLTPSELDITNQLAELAFSCLEDPITADPTKLSPIPFTNLEEALTDLVENYTVIKAYPSFNGTQHLDLKFTLKPEFNRLSYFNSQKQQYAVDETEFQAYNLLSWLSYDGFEYKFSNFLSNDQIKFFYFETYSKLFKPQLKFLQLLQEQLNKYKQYLESKQQFGFEPEVTVSASISSNSKTNANTNATDLGLKETDQNTFILTPKQTVNAINESKTTVDHTSKADSSKLDHQNLELYQHEQELEEYEQTELEYEEQHSSAGTASQDQAISDSYTLESSNLDSASSSSVSQTSTSLNDHELELDQHEQELEEYEQQERLREFYHLAKQNAKDSTDVKRYKDKKSKDDKSKAKKAKDKTKYDQDLDCAIDESKSKDKKDKKEKEKYKSSSINSLIEKKLLDLIEALTDYKVSYDYDQSSSYIETYISHLVDLKKLAFIQAFNTLTDQYAPYHLESFDCEYESKVVQLCDEIAIDQQAQELVERATIVPIGNFNRANIFGYVKKECSRGQGAPTPGLLHLPNITLAITTDQIEQNPQLAIELFDAIKLGSFTLSQGQCYKDAVNTVNLEFKTQAKLIILNNSEHIFTLFKEFSTRSNTVSCFSGYVTRANFLLEVAKTNRTAFLRDYLINFLQIAKEDKKANEFLKNHFVQFNVDDFVQGLIELEQEQEILGTTDIVVGEFDTSTGVDLSLIIANNIAVSSIKDKEAYVKEKIANLDLVDLINYEKVYLHSTLITQLLQETLEEASVENSENNGAIPVCICRQQNLDKCCAQESSNFAKAQAQQPDLSQHSSKIYDLGAGVTTTDDKVSAKASNITTTSTISDCITNNSTINNCHSLNSNKVSSNDNDYEQLTEQDLALDHLVKDSVSAGFNKANHACIGKRKGVPSGANQQVKTNNTETVTLNSSSQVTSTKIMPTSSLTHSTATEFKPVNCQLDVNQQCSIASTLEGQAKDRVKISVDITSEASTTDSGKYNTEKYDSSFGVKTNNQAKTKLLALLARQSATISPTYERFAEVESGESLDLEEISLLECFDATSFDLKLVPHSKLTLDEIDFSFLEQNSLYVNSQPLLEQAKFYYTELVGRLVSLVRLLGYSQDSYPLSYGFVNRLLAILFRSSDTSFEVVWAVQLLDSYLQKSYGRTDLVDRIFSDSHCHNDNYYQDQLNQVLDDYIKITTSDEVVVPGQVNGLACFESDQLDKEFIGNVFRISCTANNEQGGAVLDVDTEIDFSGSTSTRAHILTSSYLKSLFNENIQFSGTIVTEQLYNRVDGDSASIANFCALASSLSKYPLKQYLAVTGAMDQYGNVLAVGGLNHKIEAFFDICKHRGLTGKQGVVIPATNAKSLQLIDEVVEAVEQGLFHIYTADHVSEVFEIMTNIPFMTSHDEELSSESIDYNSCWGNFIPNSPSLINAIANNLNYNSHGHGIFTRVFGKWFKSHKNKQHTIANHRAE